MRDFDAIGLEACRFQGSLFEQSADALESGSAVFVRRFMNSRIAARMDESPLLYEAITNADVFDELERQYGTSSYGSERYGPEELYWMGYLYRYWAYVFEEESARAYRMVGARELRGLYPAYHTLDPRQAVERILEAKGAAREWSLDEQVELLRRIRSRE